jgi:hypothetical protein
MEIESLHIFHLLSFVLFSLGDEVQDEPLQGKAPLFWDASSGWDFLRKHFHIQICSLVFFKRAS